MRLADALACIFCPGTDIGVAATDSVLPWGSAELGILQPFLITMNSGGNGWSAPIAGYRTEEPIVVKFCMMVV